MKIKQVPEDFEVDEIVDLIDKTKPSGEQTYFFVIKKNWTTESAIREISKRLGVSQRRFKFAGSKDKFAITKQSVSGFKIPEENLLRLKIKDISLAIIGKGDE